MSSNNEAGCLICGRNPCQCGGLEVDHVEGVVVDGTLLARVTASFAHAASMDDVIARMDAAYAASRKVGR